VSTWMVVLRYRARTNRVTPPRSTQLREFLVPSLHGVAARRPTNSQQLGCQPSALPKTALPEVPQAQPSQATARAKTSQNLSRAAQIAPQKKPIENSKETRTIQIMLVHLPRPSRSAAPDACGDPAHSPVLN
jgi:hypothetical protein